MKLYGRTLLKLFGLFVIAVFVCMYVYLHVSQGSPPCKLEENRVSHWMRPEFDYSRGQRTPSVQCIPLKPASADVRTTEQFPKFEFQPSWMRVKEFWDANFERRYLEARQNWRKFPLKVILMPHSHNDPGWLKTYEEHYFSQTSKILQNMIEKLQVHTNMTFVWSEMSYLSLWYERAHPALRQQLKNLVNSGRLEIVTGGWVMADEATVHIYSMLDQLIEGHQWLQLTLGVRPCSGWSVDTFGHGAVMPYLLHEAGIDGAVIQRIHYAWKQWLAQQRLGDFKWRQSWDSRGLFDLLTHNQPYDIYSIKHSCGPNPQICLGYDFRKIYGEYTEYTAKSAPVDDSNVKVKSELILEQYGRTGSLYPHNVVLVPIGDDFRYDHGLEWDQQYGNYQKIIDFINSDPSYHAELSWGTVKDYFKAVKARTKHFPVLEGDFFVYSDIFTEGRPAYWSGYFSTRPYWKVLARQVENALRNAEILYTWASARSRENMAIFSHAGGLEKGYEKLVRARRHLALFQHHDAITGTSKSAVMHDYAMKLFEALEDTTTISSHAAQVILMKSKIDELRAQSYTLDILKPSCRHFSYEKINIQSPLSLDANREVIIFNSLSQHRIELVKIRVSSTNIKVVDELGANVLYQINPIWNTASVNPSMVSDEFELVFLAFMPALSLTKYRIERTASEVNKKSVVYSNFYHTALKSKWKSPFKTRLILDDDIQLENDKLRLIFNGTSGFLESVVQVESGEVSEVRIGYAAYPSAQFRSGAYLFKPDPNGKESGEDVLSGSQPEIFVHSGPLTSEITVKYGAVLAHTTRIFHVLVEPLASAIYMENSVDFSSGYNKLKTPGFPPFYRETELFMRIVTDIENGNPPVFYTDLNGFSVQKRVKVKDVGIEGNYFPVTTAAYMESTEKDGGRRISLLVDHATGAASWGKGWLEVMIERRMFTDDARGMGQGVTDQKKTSGKFWLLLEELQEKESVHSLSIASNHLSNSLNYPPLLLFVEEGASSYLESFKSLIDKPFPCPLHLMNLRTLPTSLYPGFTPSNSSLLIIQNQVPSCAVKSAVTSCDSFHDSLKFNTHFNVEVLQLKEMDITGSKSNRLSQFSDVKVPARQIKVYKLTYA